MSFLLIQLKNRHIVEAKSALSRNARIRAFLARFLASPLQTAPAALGCRLEPPAAAYSSSSLSTAINASVGSCTVPRVRIFTDVEEALSALGELTGQSVREDFPAVLRGKVGFNHRLLAKTAPAGYARGGR